MLKKRRDDELTGMGLWPLQTFDPKAEYAVIERRLPHWSQAGTMCFLTWRTADSIPENVLRRWHAERETWLRQHGIEAKQPQWRDEFAKLPRADRVEFARTFSVRWHEQLDQSRGDCVLRKPNCANVVADALKHFDGDRYDLSAFVVMPNHVHILAAFADERAMLDQCDSWKHFTSVRINQILGRRGRFWQQDGFDHLVRSVEHFEAFRRYIELNPAKAKVPDGEFILFSKPV